MKNLINLKQSCQVGTDPSRHVSTYKCSSNVKMTIFHTVPLLTSSGILNSITLGDISFYFWSKTQYTVKGDESSSEMD